MVIYFHIPETGKMPPFGVGIMRWNRTLMVICPSSLTEVMFCQRIQ